MKFWGSCFSIFLTFVFAPVCAAQFVEGDIILSEFFEDLYLVDRDNQSVIDIFDPAIGEPSPGEVVIRDGEVFGISAGDIYRFDTANNTSELVADLSGAIFELTLDQNNDFIVVGSDGITRVDAITGRSTLVFDNTFFGPDDAVVSANGDIFVTEFFDGLGRLDADGTYTTIGNFETNQFDHIVIGDDGFLYTAPTFGSEILRINPVTGQSEVVLDAGFTGIDDLVVDLDGSLLLSAFLNGEDGVFRIDPTTGSFENLVLDFPFFSPSDIAIFRGLNQAVPEPSFLAVFCLAGLGMVYRRSR